MTLSIQEPTTAEAAAELDTAVDAAIAACVGDARAAVRALLVTLGVFEAELAALRIEIDGMTAAVSRGYGRRRFRDPAGDAGR